MNIREKQYSLSMDDAIVIVTGGGRGIGKEIAFAYASQGAKVIISDISFERRTFFQDAGEYEDRIGFYNVNITDELMVAKFVNEVKEKYGKITHLVNNAGIYTTDPIESISGENLKKTLDINVFGYIYTLKAVIPIMKQQNHGYIINMASVAAFHNGINAGPYNISKSAVLSITRTAAKELRDYNINVNAICPGLVDTPMLREMIKIRADFLKMSVEQYTKNLMEGCEQKRILTPEEIAGVALFLGSKMARGICGEAVIVSGGLIF